MKNKLAYLACPYSHPDKEIMEARYHLANRMAYAFHQRGRMVYSPLTHNITLTKLNHGKASWQEWKEFDLTMLSRCNELIVLIIPGWQESKGVACEIAHAKKLDLPIEMINPKEYFNLKLVTS